MKTLLSFILVLCALPSFAAPSYFGVKSTEAILKFSTQIEIQTKTPITLSQVKSKTPKGRDVLTSIDDQLSFLIGHFQSQSFIRAFRYPGVLGDQKVVDVKSISALENGRQLVTYTFSGKVNFHKSVFAGAQTVNVPIRLPLNPYTLYAQSVVAGRSLCTDEHYNTAGDFFYFWDIELAGCPLKKKNSPVLRFTGQMTKLENTRATYPEYPQLYGPQNLYISVIIGFINTVNPNRLSKKDDGYNSFIDLGARLTEEGFTLATHQREGVNHLQTYEKQVHNALGVLQNVHLSLILADSETDANGTFSKSFKASVENSQIVAYDGHSGLGGYLDIARFSKIKLPSFYQIFFFNGCSSYPYYNSMYFSKKPGGTKNLEILTAGLPTLTSTSVPNMMAFLSPFINGRITNYQTLLKNLEASNGQETTYLMGVNGDEDNSWRP